MRGRRVLDVGCGDGEFAVELAKRGAIVTGIDASAAMIDAAKRRAIQHNADINFEMAEAERLPFPAEEFDMVTAITILCFVDNGAPCSTRSRVCCVPAVGLSSGSWANGARGQSRGAFAPGSARRSGAKGGSGAELNFALSLNKQGLPPKLCAARSIFRASPLPLGCLRRLIPSLAALRPLARLSSPSLRSSLAEAWRGTSEDEKTPPYLLIECTCSPMFR